MRVFNEVLGVYLEVPDRELRIISIAPSTTDTLFSLDAGDIIIGVSYFCNRPEEAKRRVRVGGYLSVNYKKIDALKPDIIFATTGAQRRVVDELHNKGYPVYPVPLPLSVYGIIENIFIIADVINRYDKAVELSSSLSEKLNDIRNAGQGSVYYEIDFGDPFTIGANTYISSGLSLLGLKNIFSDTYAGYFTPEFDDVRRRDPDIIIYEKSPARSGREMHEIYDMFLERGWEGIKAVRSRNILVLEPDSLAHYGPKHIDILSSVAEELKRLL